MFFTFWNAAYNIFTDYLSCGSAGHPPTLPPNFGPQVSIEQYGVHTVGYQSRHFLFYCVIAIGRCPMAKHTCLIKNEH